MSGTAARTLEATPAYNVPVIEFVSPLPGFPEERRFVLVRLDDAGVLFALTSVEDPELRFLVVPPAPFFPDYEPEIDSDAVAELDIESAEQAILLVVLKAGDSLHTSTANLLAPVVLNTSNQRACQVVLDEAEHLVRTPLVASR